MALSIKDPETDRLARRLAKATGESLTRAITEALRERLARIEKIRAAKRTSLAEELDAIALHGASLPVLDDRSNEEIIVYDKRGLPR